MTATTPPAAPARRVYLDTSAYLALLLGQEGSERVERETHRALLVSSVVLVLEARRNLVRLARDGRLLPAQYETCRARVQQDTAVFVLRDFTLDLCESIALPAVATPRSLDLIHLQTALWFHAASPLDRFVTMDGAQEQAARELGLPV
jgi:PIN domain nuclease of toxin-antitoxin system